MGVIETLEREGWVWAELGGKDGPGWVRAGWVGREEGGRWVFRRGDQRREFEDAEEVQPWLQRDLETLTGAELTHALAGLVLLAPEMTRFQCDRMYARLARELSARGL